MIEKDLSIKQGLSDEMEIVKLKEQIVEFNKIQKELEKQIRGKLWLWFFFPFFGFLIYLSLVRKRKDSKKYGAGLLQIKTEIATNEFKIMVIEHKNKEKK